MANVEVINSPKTFSFFRTKYEMLVKKVSKKKEVDSTAMELLKYEYDQALANYHLALHHFEHADGVDNIDIATAQLTICKSKLNLLIKEMKNIQAEVN